MKEQASGRKGTQAPLPEAPVIPDGIAILDPVFAEVCKKGPAYPNDPPPALPTVTIAMDFREMTDKVMDDRRRELVESYLMPADIAEIHARMENLNCEIPLLTDAVLERELASTEWHYTAEEYRRLSRLHGAKREQLIAEFLKEMPPAVRLAEARKKKEKELRIMYKTLSQQERARGETTYTVDENNPFVIKIYEWWDDMSTAICPPSGDSIYVFDPVPVSLTLDYCIRQAKLMRGRELRPNPGSWKDWKYNRAIAAMLLGEYVLAAKARGVYDFEFRGRLQVNHVVNLISEGLSAAARTGSYGFYAEAEIWRKALPRLFELRKTRQVETPIGTMLMDPNKYALLVRNAAKTGTEYTAGGGGVD